ncbi:MAG: energy-coupling factor ABC transporter ATP-binding protein [Armatimonadota bacterium]
MTDNLFSIRNISFAYPGESPCLSEVSFDVTAGERIALLGANGSGKSTLLHILDALYFPTDGAIAALGHELTEESVETPPFGPRFRKEVGFLFQNSDAQLFCSTVEDELAFAPLQIKGWSRDEIMSRIDDTLELLEITHLRSRTPQKLSAGQKKLVALASILVVGPSVLLLDEPTAGLDPRSQSMLLEILDQLHAAGITLITATHDLALLPHLADRVIVLSEEHKLVADGTVDGILHDVELLLSVNLIHAHSHRHGDTIHTHPHEHVVAHGHSHDNSA